MSDIFKADPEAVGARMKKAREEAGMTNASEFARLIGVSPNSVYRYERGEQTPSSEVMYRIATATHRSMEWFVAGRTGAAGAALREWLESPTGQTATPDELTWLDRIDLEGNEPSFVFFDGLLSAKRHGLKPADAVKAAAAHTQVKKD